MYVLVRKDLPIEQQACQAIHAAIEAARNFTLPNEPPHLVLCGVSSEAKLHDVSNRLLEAGVRYYGYHEPDQNYELTAIATEPLQGDKRRHLRRYQVLKMNSHDSVSV